jgi:hypothetical protein
MADELFPMYCGLYAIHGMHKEFEHCGKMLECARASESCIALIYMNGTQEWIYGQCTFVHEPDHVAPFKFSNTFAALKEQRVLPTLIRSHAVTAIFVEDARLAERLGSDPSTAKYRSLITLLTAAAGRFEHPAASRASFLSRFFGG